MKATELRIGNWVQFRHTETPVLITLGDFVREYKEEHLEDYEPIPLTEDWLIKLKEDGSFKLRFIKSIAAFEVQRKYVGIESGEEWIFISNVRYVHEWQNLYFALTGEELELN